MNCPYCQAANAPGATYCGACGRSLASAGSTPSVSPSGAPPVYVPPRPATPMAPPQSAAPTRAPAGSAQPPHPRQSAFPLRGSAGVAPPGFPSSPAIPPYGGIGIPALTGAPHVMPTPKRSSTASPWIALAVAVVVMAGAVGGGAFLYQRHQQDLQSGHWSNSGATTSGAIPDGSFGFNTLGGQVVYTPPANPPVPVIWQRYQNALDGYSLDTASNWQDVNTTFQGHAQWQVCPPGTDIHAQQPGPPPCVNFGWARHHTMPSATDPAVETNKPVMVDRIIGAIYTEAGMGASVSAIFPVNGGDVYLTADADSDAAMYAFTHMLGSLHFP